MKLALGLVAASTVMSAPLFAASTTHQLDVTATVNGTCQFNTAGPTALNIANSAGAIDPTLAGNATGSATVLFRCTTGTTSAITADNGVNFSGSRRVKNGVANFMPYSLTLTGAAQAGTGYGAAGDKTLTVDATILNADFANAAAGAYADTVTLTITP